jgi:hypothetical protein
LKNIDLMPQGKNLNLKRTPCSKTGEQGGEQRKQNIMHESGGYQFDSISAMFSIHTEFSAGTGLGIVRARLNIFTIRDLSAMEFWRHTGPTLYIRDAGYFNYYILPASLSFRRSIYGSSGILVD